MVLAINLYSSLTIVIRAGKTPVQAPLALEYAKALKVDASPSGGRARRAAKSSLGTCIRPDAIGGKSQGNRTFSGVVVT